MESSSRMAANTAILYAKLIITILINLYSIRLILNAMGVEEYGIVNLISGIVAMLSFVQNSMTVSTQRYLSVNMGMHDPERQLKIFNTSLKLHFLLGIFVFIVLELLLPIIFNSSVQIPYDRVFASKFLYQLTIVGTFCVIITVPYDATLNAHENMLWFSIASITESVIRLLGAFILLHYYRDKLIFYGFLIIAIQGVSLLIKSIYCSTHYEDAKIQLKTSDKSLMKEMFMFAFWNFFGAFASSARSSGVAIVLNIFKGISINAVYGIATQVSGQLANFSATIQKAMAPQIMQKSGFGNNTEMLSLAIKQCKYSFILMLMMVVPLFVDMSYILTIWLKKVPDNTTIFCKIILFVALVQQLTTGFQIAIQATGKIKKYQMTISLILFMNIPLACLLMYFRLPAYSVLLSMFAIELVCFFVRIIFVRAIIGVRWMQIMKELIFPVGIITGISLIAMKVMTIVTICIPHFIALLIHIVFSIAIISIVSYKTFSFSEKVIFKSFLRKILNKFSRVQNM